MSEALRLAHELILAMRDTDAEHWDTLEEAAAELRRLHAENEALREANEAFGKRQEWCNRRMLEQEQRYMELLKVMADAKAMQMPTVHIDADVLQLRALNTELVEALRGYISDYQSDDGMYAEKHYVKTFSAALAKVEASNGS